MIFLYVNDILCILDRIGISDIFGIPEIQDSNNRHVYPEILGILLILDIPGTFGISDILRMFYILGIIDSQNS